MRTTKEQRRQWFLDRVWDDSPVHELILDLDDAERLYKVAVEEHSIDVLHYIGKLKIAIVALEQCRRPMHAPQCFMNDGGYRCSCGKETDNARIDAVLAEIKVKP